MSSELIGELGQVGLTIGEPMAQQTLDDEENQVVDDGLSDDSAVSGPTETKRVRVSSSRPKKFRSAWLMFDIFKDWLRPHPNPELASCSVCSRVIKAGKSELEKHATGKRHLKMLKEQQQGIVLINSGDTSADLETYTLDGRHEHLFYPISSRCEHIEDDQGHLTSSPDSLIETITVSAGQQSVLSDEDLLRVKGSSKRRVQRYRKAWEEIPECTVWLAAHPNPYKAICQLCDRIMVADITVIRQHAISKKHLVAEQSYYKNRQRPAQKGMSQDNFKGLRDTQVNFTESGAASGNEGKQQFIMYRDFEHQYSAEQQENANMSAVEGTYTTGIYVPVQERVVQPAAEASRGDAPSRLFVTKPAPHWKGTAIVNGHVTRLDVNDYKGRYVVLFFYAHNFSKVDASEINRLSDRIAEFRSVQTEIVACSTDSHLSHLTWVKKSRGDGGVAGVKIPLIADPTHVISKEYGVYIKEKGHNLRAHFIIDRRGILRHMAINDPLIGRGTDELLRIVKALQFSDSVEEPLVADWMPES